MGESDEAIRDVLIAMVETGAIELTEAANALATALGLDELPPEIRLVDAVARLVGQRDAALAALADTRRSS